MSLWVLCVFVYADLPTVKKVFEYQGKAFTHGHFPTRCHIIQICNIINQLRRKQYNHIFLTRRDEFNYRSDEFNNSDA